MKRDELPISGNLPADVAERISDQGYSSLQHLYDDADEAIRQENEEQAKKNAPAHLGDSDFWSALFADEVPEFLDVPLAQCMKDYDEASKGNEFAIGRILDALSKIRVQSLPLAEQALLTIYEAEEV